MPVSSPALPTAAELVHVRRVDGAHRVALRAAISVAIPLAVCVLTGHVGWAPYASFGAFTSLYGRASSHMVRLQMQASAAVSLTMAVVTGVLVGLAPHPQWLQLLVAGVIAASGQVIAKAHSYHPPGPLFMIFAFGAISSMPHAWSDLLPATLVAAAAALFSMAVGFGGILRDPRGLRRAVAEEPGLRLRFERTWQPAWMALAVWVAGALAIAFRVGHPYWAMVSAVAPLSAPHVTQQMARAIQRTVGTCVGLLTAAALLSLHLDAGWAVLVIALLQFGTELVVGANYAVAMLLITPMALMMGQLGHPRPIGNLLFDRGVETTIGSLVGIAVVLTGHQLRQRRLHRVAAASGVSRP